MQDMQEVRLVSLHENGQDGIQAFMRMNRFHRRFSCLQQDIHILKDICHLEIRYAVLKRAEKLSRPAKPQVRFGKLKPVRRLHHEMQAFPCALRLHLRYEDTA